MGSRSVHMELLLLSNSTNYGAAMFSHAAEAFTEVAAGDRVTFVPFALADWDGYADRAIEALGRLGIEVVSAHRSDAPDRAILDADVLMMGGGNTFRLLDALYGLGRGRTTGRPRPLGPHPLHGCVGRHQRGLPHHPHHQRHADLPAAVVRRARSGAVPDQPPLRRPRPGLHLHGRDPGRAHRGVPRGERLPGAGHVRGLLAAGQWRSRPGSPGRHASSGGRAARRSTTASTCRSSCACAPRSTAAPDPPEARSLERLRTGGRTDMRTAGRGSRVLAPAPVELSPCPT